jgi:hypothetical protein
MKKMVLFISFMFIVSLAFASQTDNYGWEDGVGTVLGSYGNGHFENSIEQAYAGTYSLKFWEDPLSGTPQGYIWWVTGLTDGDIINASFWVYDFNDVASYPKGRIWAHYTPVGGDVNSYGGSASGNSAYSTIGWSQLSWSWTYDSSSGANDGFVVEARIYSGTAPNNVIFVDNAAITVSSDTATIHSCAPPANPSIVRAYTINTTSLDIVYDISMISVSAGDYTLTGTSTITFSGASIDGTDDTIVHLTGGSPVMVTDLSLDNIADTNNSTNLDFYAGTMLIANTNTNNPGGIISNLYDATFTGIISANDAYNNVWISDASGAYNGVMIYSGSFDALVNIGDEVLIAAQRDTYLGLTELINPILISTITTGNSPYGPDVINGSDINETLTVDTDPGETWEGQLIRIENVYVDSFDAANYDYRCTDDSGTTYFHVGDNVDYHFGTITLTVGETYDAIIGVVDWYGTNYRINPRDITDIVSASNTPPSISTSYEPDPPGENQQVIVTSEVIDADGIAGVWMFYKLNGIVVADWDVMTDIGANLYRYTIPGYSIGDFVEFKIKATDNGIPPLTTYDPVALDFYSYTVIQLPLEGDIIINEIMQNPSVVSDNNGEYMEFYNTTDHNIDINGWTVRDNGSDSFIVNNGGSLIISSYGYLVIGNDGNSGTNGGYTCDYEYSGMYLANGDDEVILEYTGVIIDSVYYDGGALFPDPTGASMELDPAFMNYVDNDNGANWYTAHTAFGDGDCGSPGSANSGPLPDAPINVVITHNGTDAIIVWDAVTGATSYKIYSDTDPYGSFSTLEAEIPGTTWTDFSTTGEKKFYHVTAVN